MKAPQPQNKKIWELISIAVLVVQITAILNILYGFILFFATKCSVFYSERWCSGPSPETSDVSAHFEVVSNLSETLPNLNVNFGLTLAVVVGLIFYTFAIGGGFVVANYLKHHNILPKMHFWLHLMSEMVMFGLLAFGALFFFSLS